MGPGCVVWGVGPCCVFWASGPWIGIFWRFVNYCRVQAGPAYGPAMDMYLADEPVIRCVGVPVV